jgi:hypothetical protein
VVFHDLDLEPYRSASRRAANAASRVHDLIVALCTGGEHPPLHGILVRASRTVVYIPCTAIAGILRWEVYLTT